MALRGIVEYCVVFLEFRGVVTILWQSVVFSGIAWYCVVSRGSVSKFAILRGAVWSCVVFCGIDWYSFVLRGNMWY